MSMELSAEQIAEMLFQSGLIDQEQKVSALDRLNKRRAARALSDDELLAELGR